MSIGNVTVAALGSAHTSGSVLITQHTSGTRLALYLFFKCTSKRQALPPLATLACIHETIRQFPMGYETLVGDMGSSLSGGQKQRILLARALYKKPKILFLDEATSHLDDHNEKQINQALKLLNITQIIVAHRQETINMADRVIDIRGINELSLVKGSRP